MFGLELGLKIRFIPILMVSWSGIFVKGQVPSQKQWECHQHILDEIEIC